MIDVTEPLRASSGTLRNRWLAGETWSRQRLAPLWAPCTWRAACGIIGASVGRGFAGEMGSRENLNLRSATGVWCVSERNRRLLLVPFRRLPRPAQGIAYDRREPLLYTGLVIYLTTGVSLAIALLMS